MTAQEYILSSLKALTEPVRMEDIGKTPLEDAIFAKVMSKKFRKLKANERSIQITKRAIDYAIKNNRPVTVSFLFGGNKLWRFDEAPEVEWAELFSLVYYLRWMKSIASVYPPGARLDYYSQALNVEIMNNVPLNDTEKYTETFRGMVDWIKPYVPERLSITYRDYADEFKNHDDFVRELNAAKQETLKVNGGKLPKLSKAQKAATELNVRLRPGQDKDPLWREKVELIHQSIEATETFKRQYFDDKSLILACPTIYNGWIAVGSTKRSYAKFWVGIGVLQKDRDSYNELVLTPKQLENSKFNWEKVDIKGLPGKNFSKIRVIG
ncbi:MAG TPA: hypothetical protein VFX86_04840 [Candidatus Saccharimonadales bacterium]|nr:hypothetical protein [Candidatus Saccharimonadales bacterium]